MSATVTPKPVFWRASRSFVLLGFLVVLAGCSDSEDYQTVTHDDADHAEAHADAHDHHHAHSAPHGGHLIELGDHKFNAELVLESDPKQLVVYLLDAHAENPVGIHSAPLTFTPENGEPITLEPQPQEGDADGQASKFVATGASVDAYGSLEAVQGSLTVTIQGTEYTGEVAHDDDHDHAHGENDHDADHKHADGDDDHKHAEGDADGNE